MGPNLTRLFAEATPGKATVKLWEDPVRILVTERTIIAQTIAGNDAANARKLALLWTHGETLIAALEKLVDGCDAPADYEVAYHAAKQLLAQLELEAQP